MSTTQKIPSTFCPAKWDELIVNTEQQFAYACCKAKPLKYVNDPLEVINQQRTNLLNDIKDNSCDYCWDIEHNQGTSDRIRYLSNFNVNEFVNYKNNNVQLKLFELNIGNACNLQCVYCNPKFSSKWAEDKPYKLFTDRFVYERGIKNKDSFDSSLIFLNKYNANSVAIIGGEPLINKTFFNLLDTIKVKTLAISTNLMVDESTIDKFLDYQDNFEKIEFGVSLDSTDDISNFLRHGSEYKVIAHNLEYVIKHAHSHVEVIVHTLVTSLSIFEIDKLYNHLQILINKYPRSKITWKFSYCQTPRIQSIETLPDIYRNELISKFEKYNLLDFCVNADIIMSALSNIKFNKTLYKEMKHFFKEWAIRKNVTMPSELSNKLID